MTSDRQPDRGSATVPAAIASVLLLAVLWLGIELAVAMLGRHQVEGAADLAALAAAVQAPQGEAVACGKAAWVAEQMKMSVQSCLLDEWDARIELRTRSPSPLIGFGPVTARARAGPARP